MAGPTTPSHERREMERAGHELRETAEQGAAAAKASAASFVDERKRGAAKEVESFSSALRRAAEELRGGNGETQGVAGLAERAADGLERASRSLRERRLDDLLGDAERLARREPALFLGGAVAAGFVAARLLKASSQRRGGHGDGGHGLPASAGERSRASDTGSTSQSHTTPAAGTSPREPSAGPTSPRDVPHTAGIGATPIPAADDAGDTSRRS